uniref:DNA-binding protein n=1 Tax=Ascaris lumbricoides TaxID=6252 RepID=A0A0M3HWY5_ASCLU
MFIKDAVSLQDIFEREAKEHQGVWLFEQTYHSIAAATNPLMYKYFPMAEQQAISMDMWSANMMLWIGRTNVKVEIMKPFVECALIEDCMSPPGSELRCVFPAGNARLYANCHRYGQAAINLILALRSGLNASKYTISNSVLKARRL